MSVAFDLYSILVLGFIQSASDLIPSLVVQLVLVTFNLKLVTPFAACIFAPLPPSEVGGGGGAQEGEKLKSYFIIVLFLKKSRKNSVCGCRILIGSHSTRTN